MPTAVWLPFRRSLPQGCQWTIMQPDWCKKDSARLYLFIRQMKRSFTHHSNQRWLNPIVKNYLPTLRTGCFSWFEDLKEVWKTHCLKESNGLSSHRWRWAFAKHGTASIRSIFQKIEVVNPVGSGDSVAGFLRALNAAEKMTWLSWPAMVLGMLNAQERWQISIWPYDDLYQNIIVKEILRWVLTEQNITI